MLCTGAEAKCALGQVLRAQSSQLLVLEWCLLSVWQRDLFSRFRPAMISGRAAELPQKNALEPPPDPVAHYWSLSVEELAAELQSGANGLSRTEARRRLLRFGPNELRAHAARSSLRVLGNQLRSPLLLLLVFAAVLSVGTGQWIDATIVLLIVLCTVVIGYRREYKAETAYPVRRPRSSAERRAWCIVARA